jgi:cytochrome P450
MSHDLAPATAPARCPFHALLPAAPPSTALAPARSTALARTIPGPRGLGRLRTLAGMIRDPLVELSRLRAVHGDLFRWSLPGFPTITFGAAPDLVHHVLVEGASRYVKSRTYDGLKCFAGEGLLTHAGGDAWRRNRRMVQPAFHRSRLEVLGARVVEGTERMLAGLEGRAEIDAHEELMQLTLAIVGRAFFGVDLRADPRVGAAFAEALTFANAYATMPVRIPLGVPTRANRRFLRARAVLDGVVDRILAERRTDGAAAQDDYLSVLMAARDEDGSAMDDRQLRDEVMTMVAAGHETTGNAASWVLHLLAQHADVQERLRDEVRGVLGTRSPEVSDLARMPLLARVVSEAMRLYPAAWMIERTPVEDDTMRGHHVARGSIVAVSPYFVHRHPGEWDAPERFDPDRFLPAAVAQRSRHAYIPYGTGPRVCIGGAFATIETQLITAMIVARHRLSPGPGEVVPEAGITLRPRGLRLRLSSV